MSTRATAVFLGNPDCSGLMGRGVANRASFGRHSRLDCRWCAVRTASACECRARDWQCLAGRGD